MIAFKSIIMTMDVKKALKTLHNDFVILSTCSGIFVRDKIETDKKYRELPRN
jgi:hypothetical protein